MDHLLCMWVGCLREPPPPLSNQVQDTNYNWGGGKGGKSTGRAAKRTKMNKASLSLPLSLSLSLIHSLLLHVKRNPLWPKKIKQAPDDDQCLHLSMSQVKVPHIIVRLLPCTMWSTGLFQSSEKKDSGLASFNLVKKGLWSFFKHKV
jgi:hypothetical protein